MHHTNVLHAHLNRRALFARAFQLSGASAMLSIPALGAGCGFTTPEKNTVEYVMDLILKEVSAPSFGKTVDTLKSGSGSTKVTGIVTTMFATVTLIREAVKLNANFIIAHEPTFYNHQDDKDWVKANEVLKEKQALLDKHKIAVWRFHDYWHSYNPDGVLYGVAKQAGWQQYVQPGSVILQMPAATVGDIARHLKSSLGIQQVRVIGDVSQLCSRIALMPGAWGGQAQVSTAESEKPDLLVVGEVHEWETAEYIRDARALGKNIALVVLGHSVSEEPGMLWLAEWLKPKLSGIPVTHIASENPFTWV
ncbi:Nif3-like dinuclear metal center hexameric protein [Foetidibacter luteolus]|uniref:Nif3-like dinuclear metal center hexameric protein n=1 Tax=Foetidibacter luteolus TaxID=2608880 RepID=UPI001A981C7B|nr:Nif3-like dinuclear metal center hexameric protein [Foetidibacter luteolus]